jgi:hypothetical protein
MDSHYSESGSGATSASADQLRCLYLERLQHLVDLSAEPDAIDTAEARRLVSFATYSTYQDCAALGMRAIARRILGLPTS